LTSSMTDSGIKLLIDPTSFLDLHMRL